MIRYNEIDPFAAQWIRNLQAAGELPAGDVDERPIQEIRGADLAGVRQFHTFAGIGGWPLALKLAGWPDDEEVWTGSCPCQPFSAAGRRRGADDERHLWPAFRNLIAERRPAKILGEQVASKDGRLWLAGVRADLEALGYSVGAADLCAASVGAPHRRQRLYWMAKSTILRRPGGGDGDAPRDSREIQAPRRGPIGGMADLQNENRRPGERGAEAGTWSEAIGGGLPSISGPWSDFEIIRCTDEKNRRTGRGVFPLAHGLPRSMGPSSTRQERVDLRTAKTNRLGRLKGYGNAIVPELAAEFIKACMETDAC